MQRLAGIPFPLWILSVIGLTIGLFLHPLNSTAQARPVSWQGMPMPTGGRVTTLAINLINPSVLLAGTDAGIFLSRDGGDSWIESNRGLPPEREILSVSISPISSTLFFAGSTRGLFRSSDGGQSWERVGGEPANEFITSLALDPQDGRTLYVGTVGAFYKSINGGDSWTVLNASAFPSTPIWAMAVDPLQTQTVYAGGDGGTLLKSADGGATWRPINQGIAVNARIHSIAIHPQVSAIVFAVSTQGLFRSATGGANWTLVGGHRCQGAPRAVDFDRLNPGTVYAGLGDGGVCRSTDNGEAWTLIEGAPRQAPIFSLVLDPKTPSRIFLASANGVYGTRDGGTSWAELNGGLGSTILWLAALPGKPSVVLAGTRWNILRTSSAANDSARPWEMINGGFANTYVLSVAINPRERQHLFAGTWNGEIYQSMDGGVHWKHLSSALAGQGQISALVVSAQPWTGNNPLVLYAGTLGAGVLISRDGGVNWTAVNEGLANPQVNELHLIGGDSPILLAATTRGLYRLHQNASTRWATVSALADFEVSALAGDPKNPLTVYAGTPGGLFKSGDGGEKWNEVGTATLPTNITINSLLVNPQRSEVIYAGTEGGFFRSADGGQTWQAANEGLPPQTRIDHMAINPDEPTIIYAGTNNHGVFRGEDPEVLMVTSPPNTVTIPVDLLVTFLSLIVVGAVLSGILSLSRHRHGYASLQMLERQWPEIRYHIEKTLMAKGEIERDELSMLAERVRFRALQRYLDEHPGHALHLRLDPPAIRLSDTMTVQNFMRNWQIVLRGVETGGDLDVALARITTQLCNLLGFTLMTSRRYKNSYGYVVQAPALRLRIPPRFPIIYLPPSAIENNIASELQDMLGVMNMTSYFALLVVLSDAPSTEVKQFLEQARSESIPDFIVLTGRDLGQILMSRDPERQLIDLILDQVELTLVSPYVIAGPVPENMFFGRERELKTITRTIHDRNFAVIGGRKIGKTSVLAKVYRLLSATAGFYPLYLDCQAVQDYEDLLETVSTMWDVEMSGSAPDALRRFLHDTKAVQGERIVVLLLDEVDALLQYDQQHQESLFRVLRAAAQENFCRFVFCGEKALNLALHSPSSALFNFCEIVHIGFSEPRDARRIIVEPLAEMGIEIEKADELIGNIISLSACHPNIIQYLCQKLIAEINQRHVRRISLRDFETVRQSSAFREYFIEVSWGNTSPFERMLTLFMVKAGGRMSLSDLRDAINQVGAGVQLRDLERALDGLELYSIVRKEGDEYCFTADSFSAIIRQTYDVEALLQSMIPHVYRTEG